MNKIASKLNITSPEGWFRISQPTLQQHGAGSLLASKYDNSPSKMLATIYPEYKQACRHFVMELVRELKLSKVEDVMFVPL